MGDERSRAVARVGERADKELVPPIALRTEALGMRAVYNMLRENELDALLQQDRIDVANKEVTIRTENETLVVEGNLSQTFQRVQQLLCEQYQIIWRVC